MIKHKKGSIFSIIGLLIILGVFVAIGFSLIKDQVIFKHEKQVEHIEKVDNTLDKASKSKWITIRSNKYRIRITSGETHLLKRLKMRWIQVS